MQKQCFFLDKTNCIVLFTTFMEQNVCQISLCLLYMFRCMLLMRTNSIRSNRLSVLHSNEQLNYWYCCEQIHDMRNGSLKDKIPQGGGCYTPCLNIPYCLMNAIEQGICMKEKRLIINIEHLYTMLYVGCSRRKYIVQ